ncbi:MAG TPA: tRNA pseudouridine(55) synthase TruB [Steroidobacteraceae bacterium]|nr:tRNA pseudouridine(55) synthase TruB [Steroidobacteraceae bacterium]
MNQPSKPKRFDRIVDGIILLDKPQGMSSNAALQRVRVLLRALKAGHAGSLDPLATGMLPLCFGQATKVCNYLLDSRKTYQVTARLGIRTDSADADGSVIERRDVPVFDEAQIAHALQSFLGVQQQVPPMYSALKHQGQRLYELARAGETVERAPREIIIEHIQLLLHDAQHIAFEVRCSKGTYIRSLVEDVAERLGTIAHVTQLRRTQVDPFVENQMMTLEQLEHLATLGLPALDNCMLASDAALSRLPEIKLDEIQTVHLLHGRSVCGIDAVPGLTRAYGADDVFLGLVTVELCGKALPERLFVNSVTQ